MSARSIAAFALLGGAAVGAVLLHRYLEPPRPKRRRRRPTSRRLADVEGGKETLQNMPDRWWRKRAPSGQRACYATKTDAMNVFREWNQAVIDDYGGETASGSRGEFDAMTKYGALPTNIAQAIWLSLPTERRRGSRGFCLEDIDIEALNETSPGRNHVVGFTLPEYISEQQIDRKYQEYYQRESA